MKALTTIELQIEDAQLPGQYETIGHLEMPTIGHLVVKLARTEVGTVIVQSSEGQPNHDWETLVEMLDSAMSVLHHSLGKTTNDANYVVGKLYNLKHYLETGVKR